MPIRVSVTLAAAALLVACASSPAAPQWAPRADADLAKDQAECVREARAVDVQSLSEYSNGSVGAAAAAAGYLDMDTQMVRGARDRMFEAVRDSCMAGKGWTRTG